MATTEIQPVLTAHLEELVMVLDHAYALSLADDLARRHRNMQPQVRVSPLTNKLEEQRDRFTSYIESQRQNPEPVSDE